MLEQNNNDDCVKLTIIIVTYNHADSISNTIESVLSQKTDFRFTIHLCDDCSTDGTKELCQNYANKYPELIKFFPQEQNTFLKSPENNHVVQAYKRLNTKFFCFIEGDDNYCDDEFFQTGVSTLEENTKYSMFGANTLIRDHANNLTYESISNGDIKEYHLDEVNGNTFKFIHSQARIYRNTFTSFPQGDTYMYLYHLAFGPLYYHHKVVAVYNMTGTGVWTSLTDLIINNTKEMIAYRMCQAFNFKLESIWMTYLSRKNRLIVRFLKIFLGTKRAWHLWFYLTFVPTWGIEFLDVNYGVIKPKLKQNYIRNAKKFLRLMIHGH